MNYGSLTNSRTTRPTLQTSLQHVADFREFFCDILCKYVWCDEMSADTTDIMLYRYIDLRWPLQHMQMSGHFERENDELLP